MKLWPIGAALNPKRDTREVPLAAFPNRAWSPLGEGVLLLMGDDLPISVRVNPALCEWHDWDMERKIGAKLASVFGARFSLGERTSEAYPNGVVFEWSVGML